MKPVITASLQVNGIEVAKAELHETTFKTGSRGYTGQLKASIEGKPHGTWVNLVEFKSKPTT